MRTVKLFALLAFALAMLVVLNSCKGDGGRPNTQQEAGGAIRLNGAGATFPYPIYSKWFSEYSRQRQGVQVNYQSIGSGGGIRQVLAGTVDFGATDSPMTDELLGQAKARIHHIPTVLGAVVPAYNLGGVTQTINFTPEALAGIFLGTVKKWNDPQLVKANPGVSLPDRDILVVHRSDGSGTTFVWTEYLSKVSPEWKQKVGAAPSVNWPTGLGAKGNEGVAGQVKQVDGAIGYIELVYAEQNKIAHGAIRNAAGKFVKASLEAVTAAAGSVKDMPADFRVSITNAPGEAAYPVASFTWLLVPEKSADANKQKALKEFLSWMTDRGQALAPELGYAPLPASVLEKVKATVSALP